MTAPNVVPQAAGERGRQARTPRLPPLNHAVTSCARSLHGYVLSRILIVTIVISYTELYELLDLSEAAGLANAGIQVVRGAAPPRRAGRQQ